MDNNNLFFIQLKFYYDKVYSYMNTFRFLINRNGALDTKFWTRFSQLSQLQMKYIDYLKSRKIS